MWPNDLPKDAIEFDKRFGTEEGCREYLLRLKWPTGFKCPRCGKRKYWFISGRHLFQCTSCNYQSSLTAGTVMEGTKKPLVLWFKAMYLMVGTKIGVSARELQRQLGLGSYQTAWTWLQKLRRVIGVREKRPLEGPVEADESYVGGREEGVKGRQTEKKSIVVEAVEMRGRFMGRVRLGKVPDASGESLEGFIGENVAPGSDVVTDGWPGYKGLKEKGYGHEVKVIGKPKRAAQILPMVHRVFSLLDRVLLGTYQGSVSGKHMDHYLEEFGFRFNRRRAKYPTRKVHRLAQIAARTKAIPYWKVIGRSAPNVPLDVVAA